nr:formin-like protein 5 [Penaeus vannamei]
MVGRLMVEDEYTINVKVRRPLGEEACLAPPTITITPDSSRITLTPPDNSTLTYAHASKSVNGSPPMAVGCSTLPRSSASSRGSWATLPHPSRHAAGAKPSGSGLEVALASKAEPPAANYVGLSLSKSLGKQVYDSDEAPALRQQIMPPPPPERRAPPGLLPLTAPLSPCSPDLPLSPPAGVTHGCLPLPIIQVFADDSSHVATNRFIAPPRLVSPHEGVRRQGSPRPVDRSASHTAAGCLYVPRIPEHCKSDSGMLYVPPVDEHNLRQSRKDGPPAKGNSRRRKAIEASPDSQGPTPTGAPAPPPAPSQEPGGRPRTPCPPGRPPPRLPLGPFWPASWGPGWTSGRPTAPPATRSAATATSATSSSDPRLRVRPCARSVTTTTTPNNNRNNQYLAEESYNNSLNTYKSNRASPFSSPGKRSPEDEVIQSSRSA